MSVDTRLDRDTRLLRCFWQRWLTHFSPALCLSLFPQLDDSAYEPPERRPTHKKLPRRTAFTAAFLLFVGVVFSTLGLSFLFTLGMHEALPFLIIGGIGFIPGSYVSFIIYQTWKGVPGYSYDQIPSYDDQ